MHVLSLDISLDEGQMTAYDSLYALLSSIDELESSMLACFVTY